MKIIFTTKRTNIELSFSEPLTFPDFLNIVMNGVLANMNGVVTAAPEDIKEDVKADLYDLVNETCSELLLRFAPEYEQHPGLTEEAILKAENELIEQKYEDYIKQHPEAKDMDILKRYKHPSDASGENVIRLPEGLYTETGDFK